MFDLPINIPIANEDEPNLLDLLDPKERYALLGQVVLECKKKLIMAQAQLRTIHRLMDEAKAKSIEPTQQQILGHVVAHAEVQGLPNVLKELKEMQFEVYEQLHPKAPAKR